MGVGYNVLGRIKEAAFHFEKAFEFYPAEMASWYGDVNRISGFVLVKLGDIPGAIERFELLLDGDEGARANGLRSMALLKMYQGKHISAMELFKQAVALNEHSEEPLSEFRNRMYLARAYQSMGMDDDKTEELALSQELAEKGGWGPDWTIFLAIQWANIGDIPKAQAWLDSWIGSNKINEDKEWAVELLRGEIALVEGKLSVAAASIELASQLNQNHGFIKEALGRAYFADGQLEKAEASFLEAIRLMHLGWESQEPWILAHYRLGLVYEALGDAENSRIYLEKFLDLWGSGDEGLVGVTDARRRLQ